MRHRTFITLLSGAQSVRSQRGTIDCGDQMTRNLKKLVAIFATALAASAASASAQTYPSRPVTLIVPLPPGVGTDSLARILAEHMKGTLDQAVIIENVTGAGGTIGTARAAHAAPDGYTLSVGNIGTHVVSPVTYPNIQYHPLNDF
jgi:tripartite-type tricarboxylate transporter receptor subunit TctC